MSNDAAKSDSDRHKEKKERTGWIYKTWHISNPNLIYIGSTTNELNTRLSKHLSAARRKIDNRRVLYEYIRKKNFQNFKIASIEKLKFKERQELRAREEHYIRTLKAKLNMHRAYLPEEEAKQSKTQ